MIELAAIFTFLNRGLLQTSETLSLPSQLLRAFATGEWHLTSFNHDRRTISARLLHGLMDKQFSAQPQVRGSTASTAASDGNRSPLRKASEWSPCYCRSVVADCLDLYHNTSWGVKKYSLRGYLRNRWSVGCSSVQVQRC